MKKESPKYLQYSLHTDIRRSAFGMLGELQKRPLPGVFRQYFITAKKLNETADYYASWVHEKMGFLQDIIWNPNASTTDIEAMQALIGKDCKNEKNQRQYLDRVVQEAAGFLKKKAPYEWRTIDKKLAWAQHQQCKIEDKLSRQATKYLTETVKSWHPPEDMNMWRNNLLEQRDNRIREGKPPTGRAK